MTFRLFFPSEPWAIALLVLSIFTVALAGLRRMRLRSKPATARRIRSYGVPLVACFVCCSYAAYLNTPRTLDRTLIAGFDELKQELQAKGQVAGSLSVLSGFPFAWHQAAIDPAKYKFIGRNIYILRLALSAFVIAASMIALAALLGRLSKISLSHLILAQTVIALVIFLHVTIDATYHWAASAILIAAPQLVYLPAELRRACIASADTVDSDGPKCCELEAKV